MDIFVKHIQKEFSKHTFDYLLLFTGGIFFLLALNYFKGERLIEFIILFAFVSFYMIWGMTHHIINNRLHIKNMLEYILLGFICLFLLKILIFP